MRNFLNSKHLRNLNKSEVNAPDKEPSIDARTQFIRNVSHRMAIDPIVTTPQECPNMNNTPGSIIPKFVQQLFTVSNEYNRKMKDIVEYSAVVNGEFVPVEGPLLIRNLISTAIANATQRMKNLSGTDPVANIDIQQGIPISELIGDGPAVTNILQELIFNGFRHSLDEEVYIRAWTDKYENTKVYFSVENTGILVPPGELESIFEPFNTTSTSEGVVLNKGAGVGLAKCKLIATILRGSLSVESEETTMFTLSIPFKNSKDLVFSKTKLDVKYERSLSKLTDYGDNLSKPTENIIRVLVVDDSPVILRMFDKMLEKIGVCAEVCLSPILALEKATEIKYDAIFLDVVMPVMNGITCAHAIRDGETTNKNTPIIVVTADMTTETRQLTTYIPDSILIEKPARLSVITTSLISIVKDKEKTKYLQEDEM